MTPHPRQKSLLARIVFCGLLVVSPAAGLHAQAPTKIFVASYGNDANDGSRGSPKRNFQAAHNAVSDGGRIIVLDTAGYGALAITKGVSVTVPPGVNGIITVTSGDGVTIDAIGRVVSLRGLIIEGAFNGNGIYSPRVTKLEVVDCQVRQFSVGVLFKPDSQGELLQMDNTTCRDCTTGLRCELVSGSSGATAVVTNSRILSNTYGAVVVNPLTGNILTVLLADCTLDKNFFDGVTANGIFARVAVDRCRITHSGTGVVSTNNGVLLSLGNNTFFGNSSDGNFTGTFNPK